MENAEDNTREDAEWQSLPPSFLEARVAPIHVWIVMDHTCNFDVFIINYILWVLLIPVYRLMDAPSHASIEELLELANHNEYWNIYVNTIPKVCILREIRESKNP